MKSIFVNLQFIGNASTHSEVFALLKNKGIHCSNGNRELTEFIRVHMNVAGTIASHTYPAGHMLIRNSGNPWLNILPEGTTNEAAKQVVDAMWAEYNGAQAKLKAEREAKDEVYRQQRLVELMQLSKGWYVVTLDATVSRTRGNDGTKTYSVRVLAESQHDAFQKAVEYVHAHGHEASNVDFVYNVNDNVFSAMIEYVGVWTDAAEAEYAL